MFGDIGWAEMLLIGVVALVVIGPEDLPQMFRQIGRFTAKIRAMSRDFSRAMEQAAAETGVKDMAKDIKAATSVGGAVGGMEKMRAAADKFEKWDPLKPAGKLAAKPLVPAPMPTTPVPAAIVAEPPADQPANQPADQLIVTKTKTPKSETLQSKAPRKPRAKKADLS